MSMPCPACSKTNPADAKYCYYDGRSLTKDRPQGPLHVGTLPFPMPFYFSDGQGCANFNQLALACDERWDEAKSLLAEGYWPTFFRGIGRLDLAATANLSAKEPNLDIGLSQLLEKFPADPEALRLPKLAVEAPDKHLGQLTPGTDHVFELMVSNRGMLVLRGMISTNCEWLAFGDRTGSSSLRMFQTRNIFTLPVRVVGSELRAGLKPLLGEIVVDTNGGTMTVAVRVDIPIRPFPKGVHANDALAGARTPHEVALKAKDHPLDAGVLFEQGAVKAWYVSNGWRYPVDGPEATGKGAVQQFFEALGLTKPPHLEINAEFLSFRGRVGERLSQRVTVSTEEAKPVYAQAWSNQNWLTFGPTKYMGNRVKLPVEITVPPTPGQTLTAQITIQGNGKQRFVLPVSLTVEAANAVDGAGSWGPFDGKVSDTIAKEAATTIEELTAPISMDEWQRLPEAIRKRIRAMVQAYLSQQ